MRSYKNRFLTLLGVIVVVSLAIGSIALINSTSWNNQSDKGELTTVTFEPAEPTESLAVVNDANRSQEVPLVAQVPAVTAVVVEEPVAVVEPTQVVPEVVAIAPTVVLQPTPTLQVVVGGTGGSVAPQELELQVAATGQTAGFVSASAVNAPVVQTGNVVVQPMAPQVNPPKYTVSSVQTVAGWTTTWTAVALLDRGDGTTYQQFAASVYPPIPVFNPGAWPTAPNVPNPLDPSFKVVQGAGGPEVPDGVEIPSEGIQNFCESVPSADNPDEISHYCRIVVPPGHYVIISGDGEIPGIWKSAPGYGNFVIFWNVGEMEGNFTGTFKQPWFNKGRFWNGDTLPIAINALSSHTANNMLDLPSALNPTTAVNAGGNCSVKAGCTKVFGTDIVISGSEPMLVLTNSAVKQ